MTGSTGSSARRCRMSLWPLSNVSSCCVSGYGSGAGFTHSDLAACPSAGRFDGLARAIVVRECLFEVGQDALGAIGGPGGLCPAVPHRGFFGALLLAAVCHGYPSVRL
jgi:hypothetical protein